MHGTFYIKSIVIGDSVYQIKKFIDNLEVHFGIISFIRLKVINRLKLSDLILKQINAASSCNKTGNDSSLSLRVDC